MTGKQRLELAKKAKQRRIDELKRRIEEKDFIVKKNPTPIDDELKQLGIYRDWETESS